jgi:hypothetical protein
LYNATAATAQQPGLHPFHEIGLFAALGARGEQAGIASRPARRAAEFLARIHAGRSADKRFRLMPLKDWRTIDTW